MRGKGSELGEPCPKVRLSQDRLPIKPFVRIFLSLSQAYLAQMSFEQMPLRANVTQPCLTVTMLSDAILIVMLSVVMLAVSDRPHQVVGDDTAHGDPLANGEQRQEEELNAGGDTTC